MSRDGVDQTSQGLGLIHETSVGLNRQQPTDGDLATALSPTSSDQTQINAILKMIPLPENKACLTSADAGQLTEGKQAGQTVGVCQISLIQVDI